MAKWWIVPLAAVGAYLLTSPATARRPLPPQGGGFAQIQSIASQVEQRAQIPGFTAFALGTAQRESLGNNLAVNDSPSEAAAACRGYKRNLGDPYDRYVNNPFPAERWCWGSGGWYGQLPSTALAAPGFHEDDPYLVFDPVASTVLLADWIRRVKNGFFSKLPPEHRNWLTVRRFMSSNKIGLDYNEQLEKSPKVRERFAADLAKRGIDPSFMYKPVTIGNWPGAVEMYAVIAGT